MADSIERALEETVPILRAVQRAKLLTPGETQEVVRTRRNHEYSVSSRKASRADFLKYAAFERELASVLLKRAKKKKVKKVEVVIGKSAARVNLVYSRAVKKFHGDDELWVQYARHCVRSGSIRAAGKVFAKALGFRPDSERVWLAAIAFHFDTCSDARGGRAIAQRALRALPDSRVLWKEYFRMEVNYLAKLGSRRVALGLSLSPESRPVSKAGDKKAHEEESREKAENIAMDSNAEAGEGEDVSGDGSNTVTELDNENEVVSMGMKGKEYVSTARKLSFWDGGVPMAVFFNACKTLNFSDKDCAELWDVVSSIPFVPSKLLESLAEALKAKFQAYISSRVVDVRLLWDLEHAQFVMKEAMRERKKTFEEANAVKLEKEALVEKALVVFSAIKSTIVTQVTIEWNDLQKTAALSCVDSFRTCVSTIDKSGAVEKEAKGLKSQLIAGNILSISATSEIGTPKTQPGAWKVNDLLENIIEKKSNLNPIYGAFKEKVLVPFRDLNQDRALCAWLSREGSVKRLRNICDIFLPLPPTTLDSLRAAISAEIRLWNQAKNRGNWTELEKKETINRTRRLFRKAVDLKGAKHDVDLWLDYIDFERITAQDLKQVTFIGWKALKSLEKSKVEIFTELQTLRNLG